MSDSNTTCTSTTLASSVTTSVTSAPISLPVSEPVLFPLRFPPVTEPPSKPTPSLKRTIHGILGVDLLISGDQIELRQIGQKGGQKITKQTKPDDVKSLTLPLQMFVNLPFDSGFNAFVTRAWNPNHPSEDPHESHTIQLDTSTTLEANIKRHNQCITLRKVYCNLKDGGRRRAFGTEMRFSPFTLMALLWTAPQMRLVQMVGSPDPSHIKFVEHLLDNALALFSRHQKALEQDRGLKPLVLQLGVATRKLDYDRILQLLSMKTLRFPTTEDATTKQCLEQIVALTPKLVLMRGFGLSPENSHRIQTACVFGIAQSYLHLRFTLMTSASPTNAREETLLYQALLYHPDGVSFSQPLGAMATWFERFKSWKEANPTDSPKDYWAWVDTRCREINQQFASQS